MILLPEALDNETFGVLSSGLLAHVLFYTFTINRWLSHKFPIEKTRFKSSNIWRLAYWVSTLAKRANSAETCLKLLIRCIWFFFPSSWIPLIYYDPLTKLREGNVFSCVCPSFCPQGGSHVTITYDALDVITEGSPLDWTSLYKDPPPPAVDVGPHSTGPLEPSPPWTLEPIVQGPPGGNIWWQRLETCTPPPQPNPISTENLGTTATRIVDKWTVRTPQECFLVEYRNSYKKIEFFSV